jgi:hypothetical protein
MKFTVAFAHKIDCYGETEIEAETEEEAIALCQKAVDDYAKEQPSLLDEVTTRPEWNTGTDPRIYSLEDEDGNTVAEDIYPTKETK